MAKGVWKAIFDRAAKAANWKETASNKLMIEEEKNSDALTIVKVRKEVCGLEWPRGRVK